ncbi:Pr6Pr family membrane protein [Exiguobacterium acetylicum]|uniref:Pr6Pr family membrane protein n=1 Tax=Exiguobacterium acetylicum TaxID=41170 RepID=UPI001EE2B884|nr:Pr6Pr family membrane protein [Exiguobacterium acetylicum]UKS57554.1 Pr6Pr family membrane protein [Exiguobacterium acetylicum]
MLIYLIRIAFGLLGLTAVIFQFQAGLSRPTFNPINFFSYFTILSNLLFAILLLLTGWSKTAYTKTTPVRGATTLYMIITGLVYITLLRGLEESLQTPIPWVNTVLHYIMPTFSLINWLIFIPRYSLRRIHALLWLVFPLVYLVYSLVRGRYTDFYPYPFLNVTTQGIGNVLFISFVIMIVFVILSIILRFLFNRLQTYR